MTQSVGAEQRERAIVMRTLLLDAVAAQAIALLADHGLPAILLKGRVTADWLYRDAVRNYGDVDLLVDPAQRDRAIEVLATVGYRHWLEGADELEYSSNEVELVGPNHTCIDLHHTLIGVMATPVRCWEVLSQRTEKMTVGGRTVTVLDSPARTMHLALHLAQNGPVDTKAVADLERGLAQLPFELWQEAEQLARSIDAVEAFASGLRIIDAGRPLATQLGLESPRDVGLVLRGWSAPPQALQIHKFVEADSLGSRLRLVGRTLWPTTARMLGRVPPARAGRGPLLVARLRRIAGLPSKLGVGLRSWSRARRTVRRLGSEDMSTRGKGRS